MIGASPSVKVFAYTGPVDMRKGFDGLFGLVKTHLGRDPLSGDLFVFVSRNRKRAKVLLWDGTGLCLYAKRLERGQFANLWSGPDKAEIELPTAELLKEQLEAMNRRGRGQCFSGGHFLIEG